MRTYTTYQGKQQEPKGTSLNGLDMLYHLT